VDLSGAGRQTLWCQARRVDFTSVSLEIARGASAASTVEYVEVLAFFLPGVMEAAAVVLDNPLVYQLDFQSSFIGKPTVLTFIAGLSVVSPSLPLKI
jgi:hypothetical protein